MSTYQANCWATTTVKPRSKPSVYSDVVDQLDYHPVIKEIIAETLEDVVPEPEVVRPPHVVVYEYTKGDWKYTIGWSKPKVTVDAKKTARDEITGLRVSYTEPRRLRFRQAIMVCTNIKNGYSSMRRYQVAANGAKTFTDCRQGGLGSGLSKDQIAKTLPGSLTKKSRQNLVKWMLHAYSQIA